MQGVYKIRNKLNNKRYVGSTNNFEKRWADHRKSLRNGDNSPYLQNAFNKHGEDNFVFEVVEEIVGSGEDLIACEQGYLDKGFELGILYNIAIVAGGRNLGEEVNRKLDAREKKRT